MGIKRRLQRQEMKHTRGKKRCLYCKANSVINGTCSSCHAVIKRDVIPEGITANTVEESIVGAMAVATALMIRNRKRKNMEESNGSN